MLSIMCLYDRVYYVCVYESVSVYTRAHKFVLEYIYTSQEYFYRFPQFITFKFVTSQGIL